MPAPATDAGPRLAFADLLLALLLGALALLLLPLLLPGSWLAYYAVHLWLPLMLLAGTIYGGALLAGRHPWLTRLVRLGRFHFVDMGGGAYGAIALVSFFWLEWAQLRDLFDWIVQTEWYTDKFGVREIVRDAARNVVDFFLGSFMNGVSAFAWPAFWKKAFSAGQMWPAAVVGWIIFDGTKWGVRQLPRRANIG